jgi:hypothetical protein
MMLNEFRAVVAEMRELGVASWTNSPVGDVILGQAPAPRAKKADRDPLRDRRIHYTELLGRPVTDSELEKLP